MKPAPAAALQTTSRLCDVRDKERHNLPNLAVLFAKRTAKLTNFHKEQYTSIFHVNPYVRKAICCKFGVKERVVKFVIRGVVRFVVKIVDRGAYLCICLIVNPRVCLCINKIIDKMSSKSVYVVEIKFATMISI
jgi:hypothetical protein